MYRNVDLRRFVPLDAAVVKGYGVVLLVAFGMLAVCDGVLAQGYGAHRSSVVVRNESSGLDYRAGHEYEIIQQSATPKPLGLVIFGTAGGTALGISAGLLAGYLVDSDAGDSWVGVTEEMLLGAAIGSTVGSSIGAYLSNGRQGNVYVAIGAAGVMTAVTAILAETRPLLAAALPIVHVGLTVTIVRLTD